MTSPPLPFVTYSLRMAVRWDARILIPPFVDLEYGRSPTWMVTDVLDGWITCSPGLDHLEQQFHALSFTCTPTSVVRAFNIIPLMFCVTFN